MANTSKTKRARIGPAPGAMRAILGDPRDCNSLLQPLHATRGLIFPYTPDVTFGGNANYSSWHFTHSNYQQYQYQNSAPSEIQVVGTFTAQTNEEARYMLAALTFLRASTMIDFGNEAVKRDTAGTPPPVLRFNYLGAHMFNNVPVVLQNYSYLLERDVDYVEITSPGARNNLRDTGAVRKVAGAIGGDLPILEDVRTYMPTSLVITLMLGVQPNPRKTREEFDLDAFKRGNLINKGFI
jgi:hypothetical protein